MNKKSRVIMILIVVLLVIIGGYFWWQSNQHSTDNKATEIPTKSTQKQSAVSHVNTNSSTKSTSKNNLDLTKLGAQTTAVTILSYARQLTSNSQTNSWSEMYQKLDSTGIQIVLSKDNTEQMDDSGTGIAYYILPQNININTVQLKSYPCYTLSKDKSIHLYDPNHFSKPLKTTTLKAIVQAENQDHEAETIRKLANQVKIVDFSNKEDDDTLTSKELNEDNNYIAEKAAIFFGIHNINNKNWSGLRKLINKGSTLIITPSDEGGNAIVLNQAGSTGCIYYLQPANADVDRPDVYFYGHDKFPEDGQTQDDYGSAGVTINEIRQYVNANGGRKALNNIKFTANSKFN